MLYVVPKILEKFRWNDKSFFLTLEKQACCAVLLLFLLNGNDLLLVHLKGQTFIHITRFFQLFFPIFFFSSIDENLKRKTFSFSTSSRNFGHTHPQINEYSQMKKLQLSRILDTHQLRMITDDIFLTVSSPLIQYFVHIHTPKNLRFWKKRIFWKILLHLEVISMRTFKTPGSISKHNLMNVSQIWYISYLSYKEMVYSNIYHLEKN